MTGKDPGGRQVFRSPAAVVIWWLWVLFAVANLIDLAIQGRDHVSLVAAFVLLFVTGIVYVTAQRPRMVADADGLTISQPSPRPPDWLGGGRGGRPDRPPPRPVRVAGRGQDGPAGHLLLGGALFAPQAGRRRAAPRGPGRGAAAASAVRAASAASAGRPFGASVESSPEGDALRVDADRVIATLTARAEKARLDAPDAKATAPASTWDLIAVASVVIPGLALLVTALT